LLDIREKRDMAFLFIAHDLKVACYFCDRIGVMYHGELMEEAPAADLYRDGIHPYTQLLFSSGAGTGKAPPPPRSAIPVSDASCAFAGRCPRAEERCFREHPVLSEVEHGHFIRCFVGREKNFTTNSTNNTNEHE
jgi:oligopeptide/dipeptide ABC transporter ATP-binding protein